MARYTRQELLRLTASIYLGHKKMQRPTRQAQALAAGWLITQGVHAAQIVTDDTTGMLTVLIGADEIRVASVLRKES